MAESMEELMRYGMDCELSYSVEERLQKVGWKRHPVAEGSACGCGGTYNRPDYPRNAPFLKCDKCERRVQATVAA